MRLPQTPTFTSQESTSVGLEPLCQGEIHAEQLECVYSKVYQPEVMKACARLWRYC
jgi:hypothetical protein